MTTPTIEHWGLIDYDEALRRQQEAAGRLTDGQGPEVMICCEHPATITLGRHCPDGDVVADSDELARRRIVVASTDRGGRATYHGPGQAVVYPIVAVGERRLGARPWVELLERALLAVLARFGVHGRLEPGRPGVWAARGKIASLGLRIVRGVSYHGVSCNVSVDTGAFDSIITCGTVGEHVSSIAVETGRKPATAEVSAQIAEEVIHRLQEHPRDGRTTP